MLCLGVLIILYVWVALVLTGMVTFKRIDVGNTLSAALSRIGVLRSGALAARAQS
jgi:APA family basic amino acid/polyamine antiporter